MLPCCVCGALKPKGRVGGVSYYSKNSRCLSGVRGLDDVWYVFGGSHTRTTSSPPNQNSSRAQRLYLSLLKAAQAPAPFDEMASLVSYSVYPPESVQLLGCQGVIGFEIRAK